MPMAMLSGIFGLLGDSGSCACCTTDRVTGDFLSEEYRESSTTVFMDLATALAMDAVSLALVSSTEMLTNAVSVGLVTVSCCPSCATFVSRPSSSMTGWSTASVVASVGYDLIWLEMYVPALLMSL